MIARGSWIQILYLAGCYTVTNQVAIRHGCRIAPIGLRSGSLEPSSGFCLSVLAKAPRQSPERKAWVRGLVVVHSPVLQYSRASILVKSR